MDQREGKLWVDPREQVKQIMEAARELGVEVNETDTVQWLTAMAAAEQSVEDVALDVKSGVYGHRVTLLDFNPRDLARFRWIADIVQIEDRSGVQSAISLSGSAAQSLIQQFPGDCDYFERVNIQAATREEACKVLADVMREKALDRFKSPVYELIEVRFGTYLTDVVKDGKEIRAGSPISWTAEEVKRGSFEVFTTDGQPMTINWEYGCQDPGWCKMDWVVAEPAEGRVVNVSNMLDVTWEAPDGSIVPLDGFIDPYFQEVYLEADSIPLFTKLVKHLAPTVLQKYVSELEDQVIKYTREIPNYGKAAKRMYNIFRLTGRHKEAMFIRELFDEPAAALYQVWSLLDTIDDAGRKEASVDRDAVVAQTDSLIRQVVAACEGPAEVEIVTALLRLRDDIIGRADLGDQRDALVGRSRQQVVDLVNQYFQAKLLAVPEIATYLGSLGE